MCADEEQEKIDDDEEEVPLPRGGKAPMFAADWRKRTLDEREQGKVATAAGGGPPTFGGGAGAALIKTPAIEKKRTEFSAATEKRLKTGRDLSDAIAAEAGKQSAAAFTEAFNKARGKIAAFFRSASRPGGAGGGTFLCRRTEYNEFIEQDTEEEFTVFSFQNGAIKGNVTLAGELRIVVATKNDGEELPIDIPIGVRDLFQTIYGGDGVEVPPFSETQYRYLCQCFVTDALLFVKDRIVFMQEQASPIMYMEASVFIQLATQYVGRMWSL